jgi:hypothetical protein
VSGLDHGVGHRLLFLDDAKALHGRKNKGFKGLGHYAEWPKVADAVIKAIVSDAIKGAVLVQIDNSALPNEITATLPATGTYLITIAEQPLLAPGERFRGDYCVTLESSGGATQMLEPTAWVE